MRPAPLAIELFHSTFGRMPGALASAPGRLEILGNHTDYNEGLVLSCAAGFRTAAAVGLAEDDVVEAVSANLPGGRRRFALEDAAARGPAGEWSNYLRGLAAALSEHGVRVPGFRVAVASELPLAAGMSSSAALEISVLLALVDCLGLDFPPEQLARFGQEAESRAVGARTGLLDQLSSLCGRAGHLLQTEFRGLEQRHCPLPAEFAFVVADSGVKHDLAAEYNERRASCERAVEMLALVEPGLRSLRDADRSMLERHAGVLEPLALKRAWHVVGENARVREAVVRLRSGDAPGFGRLLSESHRSSQRYFENSCPELDALVELAEADPRCFGARLSGGGFGGVTVHLVEQGVAAAYAAELAERAEPALGKRPWTTVCPVGDGARLEDLQGRLAFNVDQE
ncbi:MAG: galactokinase [Planctomycetes bacterium]|nr:galactokinase [Planctomycetota bacterium]